MFLGDTKSPRGNGDTHSLGFPPEKAFLAGEKSCFFLLAAKKTLWAWGHALPSFGQVPPGASGVRRPRASPLGNLTTVGHLAKVSPDLSPHFQTQKPHF